MLLFPLIYLQKMPKQGHQSGGQIIAPCCLVLAELAERRSDSLTNQSIVTPNV